LAFFASCSFLKASTAGLVVSSDSGFIVGIGNIVSANFLTLIDKLNPLFC